MLYLAVFSLAIFQSRAKGYSAECFNCYSLSKEGCMNPYKGRYEPNSSILIPDCSYDMARNFHTSTIYVLLKHKRSALSIVDDGFSAKWNGLGTASSEFFCCKALMNVTQSNGVELIYVIRGCCFPPSVYDQCEEIQQMMQKLVEPGIDVSYKVEHCSSCANDRCNFATSFMKLDNDILTMISVIALVSSKYLIFA